jgi:hypothetical protein
MLKSSESKLLMFVLILLTLLYLNTAVITGGGGFRILFVAKPFHGFYSFYHPVSGEEGAWRALAESPNPPWWITGDYVLILTDSYEGDEPIWRNWYQQGYYLTGGGWSLVFLMFMKGLIQKLKHKKFK